MRSACKFCRMSRQVRVAAVRLGRGQPLDRIEDRGGGACGTRHRLCELGRDEPLEEDGLDSLAADESGQLDELRRAWLGLGIDARDRDLVQPVAGG